MKVRGALVLVACVFVACERAPAASPAPTWRSDCPTVVRPAPLSLEAAREAHEVEERRHESRLREASVPGSFRHEMQAALNAERLAAGAVCMSELDDLGQMLFEHEYGFVDGLGGGPAKTAPRGPFRRVHAGEFGGPETVGCPSCHWLGGPNGAGAETDNTFLTGDGEQPASGDARNPPALVGLGVVQALAAEMSRELQRQRASAVRDATHAAADRDVALHAKGVDFGVMRVDAKGAIDATGLRGVDADLVVKPFGWKGTLPTFADFANEALQIHMGIQSDSLVAGGARAIVGDSDADDPDGDGMRSELGRGPFAAMSLHLALLELPIVEPFILNKRLPPPAEGRGAPTNTSFAADFQRGRQQFHELGCAGCHVPMMVLESPVVTIDGLPPVDLSAHMHQPGLRYDATLAGYPVWLFSDLKRHDMGQANVARHVQRGVAVEQYLTPRLWGVADSAPYLHDGRAPTVDYAIAGHDGEGAAARAAFEAIPWEERGPLRVYLMALRRAPRVFIP